jgi:site-specific DNA-methyltransferase (adenine-specific)
LGIRPVADFETLNYQIMTDLNTSTEATITDETAIGFIPCYRLPFLSLFHADCMEIMKQYPDKYFDLAIVDPPYGDFNGTIERTGGTWSKKYQRDNSIKKWDFAPSEEYFKELFRVSKEQIIWGGNYFDLPPSKHFLIWEKQTISENFSMAMVEYAWSSINDNAKIFKWRPQRENGIHPTQKPVELYDWILNRYAESNQKILDTHFGSGSIALAVDKANRLDKMNLHLTACEINKEYIDKAIKRISESIKQGTLSF